MKSQTLILVLLVLNIAFSVHTHKTRQEHAHKKRGHKKDTSDDRDLQSLVAKAPSASVSASVTPKATVKVGGSTSGSASGSVTPKATVKVTATPKVSGSLSTKTSGSTGTSGSATGGVKAGVSVKLPSVGLHLGGSSKSSSSSTKSSVKLTGSCPMAKFFDMKVLSTPVEYKNKSVCLDLKSTCCDLASLKARKASLGTFLKTLSAVMWSAGNIGGLAGALMRNMNSQAQNCSTTPVPTPAKKRILQSLVAKTPSVSTKATGSTSGKLNVKVGGSSTAKTSGSASGKVGVNVKTPSVPKVTVKTGTSSGTKASGSTSGKVGLNVHVKTPTLTVPKVTLKAPSTKSTVKVTVKKAPSHPTPEQWNEGTTCKASFDTAWDSVNKFSAMNKLASTSGKACFIAVATVKTRLLCASCDNNASAHLTSNASVKATDMAELMTQCNTWLWAVSGSKSLMVDVLEYAKNFNSTTLTTALTELRSMENLANSDCQTLPTAKTGTEANSLNFTTGTTARVLQSLVAKTPSVSTKATGSTSGKLNVKVAGSSTAKTSGSTSGKVGVNVKTPSVPKVTVKTGTSSGTKTSGSASGKVTLKINLKSSENKWESYKSVTASTYAPVLKTTSTCLSGAAMKAFVKNLVFTDDLTNFKNMFVPLYKAYSLANSQLANSAGVEVWTKFKGTKKIVADVKSNSGSTHGKPAAGKSPFILPPDQTAAKKRRGLQAVAVDPLREITMSDTGADLSAYSQTGVTTPSFEGDGQVASGKLVKGLSLFLVMMVALLFN